MKPYFFAIIAFYLLSCISNDLISQTIPKPTQPKTLPESSVIRDAVEEGDFNINIGAGVPSILYRGKNLTQKIPALSGSFEYMINDGMGIGVYLGYVSANDPSSNTYRIMVGGPRLTYRFFVNQKFDVYASLVGLVMYADAKNNKGVTIPDGQLYDYSFASYLGGRYLLTENFGLYAELGWGVALLNAGATLRF